LTALDVANNNAADPACLVDTAFTGVGGNADSRALLGKMLRIDVNTTTPAGHGLCGVLSTNAALFGVPAANTWATQPTAKCPEIFAYGLRNPWRFSFDRSTGDLLIGDVGQNVIEEIDIHKRDATNGLISGVNYGWNCWEGETNFSSGGPCSGLALSSTHDPVFTYTHTGTITARSVTGGYRYRGPIASMTGLYVSADEVIDAIFLSNPAAITAPGTVQANWSTSQFASTDFGLASAIPNISSFGEDEVGNLYVVGYGNGTIYRFNTTITDNVFANGFE
jgi:Glucose / Sorbosone dehydrogenase